MSLLRTKIKNIINNLHWQTANFLTKQYKNILIPEFQTQQMAKKSMNRKLNRSFSIYSHYSFKQKLKQKGELRNCNVIECSEAYTSKTCGFCGNIDLGLGAKKIYSCHCGYICDRDLNAARNVLIRSLTKYIEYDC
jgi:putative transposase